MSDLRFLLIILIVAAMLIVAAILIGCEDANNLITSDNVAEIAIQCNATGNVKIKRGRYVVTASVDKECADEVLIDDEGE